MFAAQFHCGTGFCIMHFVGRGAEATALIKNIRLPILSGVRVTFDLQEKAQRTAAQLEILQQEVRQLSVAQVRCRCQQHAPSYGAAAVFPCQATAAIAMGVNTRTAYCGWVVGWTLHGCRRRNGSTVAHFSLPLIDAINTLPCTVMLFQFSYRTS